jgi:hypothetical protein
MADQLPENSRNANRSRATRTIMGAGVGVLVGAVYGAAAWLVNTDRQNIAGGGESLVVYAAHAAAGMAVAAAAVGWFGRKPEWVGAIIGMVAVTVFVPLFEFDSSNWMGVWCIICCPSGLVCGLLTGLVMRWLGLAK